MRKSGVQIQSGAAPDIIKMLDAGPASVKLLGNAVGIKLAEDVRIHAPNAKIVLRCVGNDQGYDRDPEAQAEAFAVAADNLFRPFRDRNLVDLVEGINEPVPSGVENAKLLNRWQVRYSNIMHSLGYKVIAYTFSVAQPKCRAFDGDATLWQYLVDGIRASDVLGVHEYSAPAMQDRGTAYCLRYRHVLSELATYGINPQVAITETGIDGGVIAGQFGGYKKYTTIDDYLNQLRWYDTELCKDPAVLFNHIFLYGGEAPWVDLGFDVADGENDRTKFISWLADHSGTITPPVIIPPVDPPMTTEQDRLKRAWNSVGVPFNPAAAFQKIAADLQLGYPVGPEYINVQGKSGQGFSVAFLESDATNVLGAKPYDWNTGKDYNPAPVVVPPSVTRLTSFPNSYAPLHFKADWFAPAVGQKFYGLIAVTDPPVLDIGARLVVQVGDVAGQPQSGIPVYHLFGSKFECFKTDGFGIAAFNLGSGSGYSATDGNAPADRFYIGASYVSPDASLPPASAIGDVYYYGLPDGHHIDCTYSVRFM